MDHSINAPQKVGNVNSLWVWFEGATALKEGQGVCYNFDYGTAAASDARRYNRVELPTILNNYHFAGVAGRDYTAQTNGQLIEIFAPGSTCKILAKKSLTIGVGRVTCQAGGTLAGYFTNEGMPGKGSAVPLQTLNTASTAGLTLAQLDEGPQSGLQETIDTIAGAQVYMAGGTTHFSTATIGSNSTFSPAAGTFNGMRKRWVVDGTQTTSAVVITYGGSAVQTYVTTTLASLTMETIADETELVWHGYWQQVSNLQITPA